MMALAAKANKFVATLTADGEAGKKIFRLVWNLIFPWSRVDKVSL